MEYSIGYIKPGNPGVFADLLLPEAGERLKNGEKIPALGATIGDLAVGAVCGQISEDGSVFEVLSLFVAFDYRRKGIATALMDEIKGLCPDTVMTIRAEYSDYMRTDLSRFFTAWGAVAVDNHTGIFYTTLGKLSRAFFLKNANEDYQVVSFREMGTAALKKLTVFASDKYTDRPEEGFLGEGVSKEHSFCSYDKKGKITGYIVLDDSINGSMTVSAVFYQNKTEVFLELLGGLVDNLYTGRTAGMNLYFPAADETYGRLLKQILPGWKNLENCYEYYL